MGSCLVCEQELAQRVSSIGYWEPGICPGCIGEAERQDEAKRVGKREKQLAQSLNRQLRGQVSPIYWDSDPSQFPKEHWAKICRWDPKGDKGLFVAGPPGGCKTRMCAARLRTLVERGTRAACVYEQDYVEAYRRRFSDDPRAKAKSESILSRANSEVLLLDDLGKASATGAWEEAITHLLEHRTSHELKTLWTVNLGYEQVLGLWRDVERRRAADRRIREFHEVVIVPEQLIDQPE